MRRFKMISSIRQDGSVIRDKQSCWLCLVKVATNLAEVLKTRKYFVRQLQYAQRKDGVAFPSLLFARSGLRKAILVVLAVGRRC
jgi:hypothetical protein